VLVSARSILITGGTGTFGKAFVRYLLENTSIPKIIVFSRDEMKQWDMMNKIDNKERLRFFIGDVRDRERLYRASRGVELVVHAAASKIVPMAEYNPFECIKTNVNGAMNVIDACIDNNVKKVVALSTDKASSPINLYGASKLVSDKMFVSANAYSGEHDTKFCVVRYGNVMGSRGSVLPFFWSMKHTGKLTVTHEKMTRFMITIEQGIELVEKAFEEGKGGEIFVKKIPSMNIMNIAKAISSEAQIEFIGVREGEKLHEQMISADDAANTYEYDDYYKILPRLYDWASSHERIGQGKKVPPGFEYSSGTNVDWMSEETLKAWIADNAEILSSGI
jgi:UDP-N-acetylglucosamine 4,6-dehydratase